MLKIRHTKGNNYVINGHKLIAKTWRDAIAEYLNRFDGSVPIFGTNIKVQA